MNVAVIGAGSWGTVIASIAATKTPTTLWVRRPELADSINASGENPDYLPGFELDGDLRATSSLEEAVSGAELLVIAVPSHGFREVLHQAAGWIPGSVPLLSLSKGIEQPTLMRMTEVCADVLPEHDRARIGVLSGPNLAREIAAGQPAATVVAFADAATARTVQDLFITPTFRVYTNDDVVGAESAGALKNVMAIAAGMSHGLGFGDNTTATLITRALAELSRLGTAMGGRAATFAGLAGMGDLIATCMSSQSRNHQVGFGLGQGRKLEDIVAEMKMVAEGVKSTQGVLALAAKHEVEMPIATQVGLVLYEAESPQTAVHRLMTREARSEH